MDIISICLMRKDQKEINKYAFSIIWSELQNQLVRIWINGVNEDFIGSDKTYVLNIHHGIIKMHYLVDLVTYKLS